MFSPASPVCRSFIRSLTLFAYKYYRFVFIFRLNKILLYIQFCFMQFCLTFEITHFQVNILTDLNFNSTVE